jgi:hypothetical protein
MTLLQRIEERRERRRRRKRVAVAKQARQEQKRAELKRREDRADVLTANDLAERILAVASFADTSSRMWARRLSDKSELTAWPSSANEKDTCSR